MSLRCQASWAKMMPLGGKLTAPACHLAKYVKKLSDQLFSLQTLALYTLGGATQIGSFLLAKPSKEGDIVSHYYGHLCTQTSPMYTDLE
jgi:hypothetical protein